MRIAGPASRPPAAGDVAAALVGVSGLLGHRPAITGLRPDGRREQGFASLAGWVAKGANLLQGELGLGPGGRVALSGPPGWPLATVALSAWWVGATVAPAATAGRTADVHVLHVASSLTAAAEDAGDALLWFGDALDGTGEPPSAAGELWTDALTPHGDRPPPAVHDGALIALDAGDAGGAPVSQRALLDVFADDAGGVVGIVRSGDEDLLVRPDAAMLLAVLALRPLVTGSASVVVDHDDAARAEHERAERIARWHA